MVTYQELDGWYHKLEKNIPNLDKLDEARNFHELVHGHTGDAPPEVISAMDALERALLLMVRHYDTPPSRAC